MASGSAGRLLALAAVFLVFGSDRMHAQGQQTALAQLLVGPDVSSAILSQQQVDSLGRQLAIDINSLPVQTTAYGSRELGAGRLNYGTLFLERAFPIGSGTFHGFASIQAARWADLDGIDMDAGDLSHRATAFLDRPSVDSRAQLTIHSQTTTIGGAYGLGPNIDVGVALPIQRVCTSGTRTVSKVPGSIERFAVDSCNTGIGDLAFKVKYTASGTTSPLRWGVLAAASAPTGDPGHLTGKGTAQATFALLMSKDRGRWQPTGSIGATVGGNGVSFKSVDLFGQKNFVLDTIEAPSSINFGGGMDFVGGRSLTAGLELIGRVISNGVQFRAADVLNGANLEILPDRWQPQILGAATIKVRLANRVIGGVQAMNQLSRPGLRPSWIIGAHITVGNLALSN